MAKFAPPEQFDFTTPEKWADWKQRFLRFRLATKLSAENEEIQVASLLYAMGPETESVFRQFHFQEAADADKWDPVIQKFDDHFIPQKNVIHHRAVFHRRLQSPTETVEQYVRALHTLAVNCDFTDKNEAIRDMFVIGIRDQEVSKQLQLINRLTLELAVQHARQSEEVANQASALARDSVQSSTTDVDALSAEVDAVRRQHQRKGPSRSDKSARSSYSKPARQTAPVSQCTNCGYEHVPGNCPAKRSKCYACGRHGHYRKMCRSKPQKKANVQEVTDEATPTMFFGNVKNVTQSRPWSITLKMYDVNVDFKIDSGADATIVSHDTYKHMHNAPALQPPDTAFCTLAGELHCLGWFEARTQYKEDIYTFQAYVVQGNTNLLGRDVCHAMKLIVPAPHVVNMVSSDVFGPIVKPMSVDPVKLTLCDDFVPYHISAPRKIPIPLQSAVAQELQWMLDNNIIRPVTEPVDWCAPISTPVKKNGQVRVCVDLRQLNKYLKRPRYQLPTFDTITAQLSRSTYFTKLDASRGYWQLPLDESSQLLTTFMTPQGRFCFTRMPFGISVASQIFQSTIADVLKDLDGVVCYQDDVLIHAATRDLHEQRVNAVLDRIQQVGMKLNKDKCVFGATQIEFLGHCISGDGVRPDPSKIKAITELPTPTPDTLKSVLGMINYLGQFVPNLQSVLKPINDLLKSDVEFIWGDAQETAFQRVKQLLSEAPALAFYDPERPTTVSCDASAYGIGGVIMQEHNGMLKPVAFCSRTLSKAEQAYAQIEKECLACTWVCEKLSMYLLGLPKFRLCTDHKPLIPLIRHRDVDKAPPRIQRLLLRLMPYRCEAEYVPGKFLFVADGLSRSPVDSPDDQTEMLQDEVTSYVHALENSWSMSNSRLTQVREMIQEDPVLQIVARYVQNGWPKYIRDVPESVKPYYAISAHLSHSSGVLTYDGRVFIPKRLQHEMLLCLHQGHWGINKTKSLASETIWWIGINKDIKNMIAKCDKCQVRQASQVHEPLIASGVPPGPWIRIGADLCQDGRNHYLVMVDYYSKYIEIFRISTQKSKEIVLKMKSAFARFGIPFEVITDNGPCFASAEFQSFAQDCGFKHTTTSPHFPQANGQVESAVKIAKKIMQQNDPFTALLQYRATPTAATGTAGYSRLVPLNF